jgi:predicted ATPase
VGPVEEQCAALERRGQFLRAQGVAAWPDGTMAGCYGFVHALHQQVVYERLPVERRLELHRRIGLREEAGYGARAHEHAAALVVHFESGREPGRAVHYRRQAADTALRRYACREAVEHLTTALVVLQTLPETRERLQHELHIHTTLGAAWMALKGYGAPEVEQPMPAPVYSASRWGRRRSS